MNKYKKNKTYI